MKQFLLPEGWTRELGEEEKEIRISGREAHYLRNVLRKAPGDRFPGLDREGKRYILRVITFKGDDVLLSAEEEETKTAPLGGPTPSYGPEITLIQCLPKGKKMDLIVRQATELGVARIVPVVSRYSVPKIENIDISKKQTRWESIIKEAVQQSGATQVPILENLSSFSAGVEEIAKTMGLGLFFHQDPLENGSLHGYLSLQPKRVTILVGPEGGLEEREISLLLSWGFHPVYVGERVLRAETAAVSALAMVQILLVEKELWKMC